MTKDKRNSLRRPLRYAAWLSLDDDKTHSCTLSDVSDTGARLDVDDTMVVPETFILWLSASGTARRHCRVIWRKPTQIGVTFEKRVIATEETPLVPAMGAAAPDMTPENMRAKPASSPDRAAAPDTAPTFDIDSLAKPET